jgi:lipoyl(octanoyl) transferase
MKIEVKISKKRIDYEQSMQILEKRVDDVINGKKNELLWVIEHNSVYTAGASSKDADLIDKNIKTIKTNRGGKHTYHGPGQKVIYFVLNLNNRGKNIRRLISNIENCIIKILNEYKIKGYADKKNIGIWVNNQKKPKKIAAIGIKVRKWIAFHGFSINVSNDLKKYNSIVPCGIKNMNVINMKYLNNTNYKNIEQIIIKKFLKIFL